MKARVAAASLASLALIAVADATLAAGADLPEIKASARNAVPACTTPGRLGAYLKARNGEVDPRFQTVATEYMRHGEQLGLRWDYAFFQMILETGALSFKDGSRQGDVRPSQNNFAGLGATGRGETGESFKDVATGVRAHLQHVMLYGGMAVDEPVAERTRKVQEWGVLTAWQKSFRKPMTYGDLASKWAPKSRSYTETLQQIADKFYDETCKRPDPQPELVAAARGETAQPARTAEAKPVVVPIERPSGADLARKAIADGKAEAADSKNGLGAGQFARAGAASGMRMLNAPPAAETPTVSPPATAELVQPMPNAKAPANADKPKVQTAAALGAAAKPLAPPQSAGLQKCRVWTASYGGQKAIIVRAVIDGVLNFTVLDVNEGQEAREAEAFIGAYAKGGAVAGEFQSQNQALDKAFEFCPEG